MRYASALINIYYNFLNKKKINQFDTTNITQTALKLMRKGASLKIYSEF